MFIGLDLGTSAMKALLVDGDQRVLAEAASPLAVSRPAPRHSEQDPAHWIAAAEAALAALRAEAPSAFAATRAIGLSGQQHGAVLLDAADRPLRPAILWNDGRADRECAALEAAWPDLRRVCGNMAMPGFTAPKLMWVARHEPEIFARVARVLLPKAYLRLWLTGKAIEEFSDASGTLWLDVGARAWSDAALAASGMARAQMPALVEGNAPAGRVRADLARTLGFAAPPLLAGGAGDNAAGACGLGAIAPGDAFVSLGTSGVLFAVTDGFAPNTQEAAHAFCHAIPATWHQMAVLLSAASCLGWWARVTGMAEAALVAELGTARRDPSPALFAPYLSGERTPHNDPAVRGAFARLGHEADRAALTQAVLEGVAFAFRDGRDALARAGTRIAVADVIGGGARAHAWAGIIADVLNIPLRLPQEGEMGPAFGAARLARMALTSEVPRAVCLRPETKVAIAPDAARAAQYNAAYAAWRGLYPRLKDFS